MGDATDRTGVPCDGPYPDNDADFTWHIHEPEIKVEDDGVYMSTWGTGISCRACEKPRAVHGTGKNIHWSISRLKNTNEAGVTQREMVQEIYDNARADGRDITRA